MDWGSILPWLILGLAIGWFIEFLIDYFFWRRKCESSTAHVEAELSTLQSSYKGMEAELAGARSTRASLEASVGEFQGKYDGIMGRVGLLAGAGGALGAIGGWLGRGGDDKEFKAQIADVNASLKAKTDLEAQVGELNVKLNNANASVSADVEKELGDLRAQLKTERGAKVDLESRIGKLQADAKVSSDLDIELGKLRGELDAERKAKAEFETRISSLQGQIDAGANMDAELGELRGQLEAERRAKVDLEGDIERLRADLEAKGNVDAELSNLRTELDTERKAKADLEGQINLMHGQLDAERKAKADIEAADSPRTLNRLGLMAGAGGLVAGLGAAFQGDDDSALEARLGELDAELKAKAELENRLGTIQAELDAAQGVANEYDGKINDLNTANAELTGRIEGLQADLNSKGELDIEIANLRRELDAERNAKGQFEARIGELQGKVDANANLEAELGQLRAQFDAERNAKGEFEARIGELQGNVDANANLEADLGQLRAQLDAERNAKGQFEARIGELQGKVDANANLEAELGQLRAQLDAERNTKADLEGQINLMHGQLDAERKAKAEVEKVDTNRTLNRFGLLAGTGGLVAGLGSALQSDDDSELQVRLGELDSELKAKAEIESRLSSTQAELGAAQRVATEYDAKINDLNQQNADLTRRLGEVPKFRWVDAKDDLKLINGIGPVMEKRLNEAGITTFEQIANANPDDLYRIAEAKEWQNIDTPDWIAQARGMKGAGKIMILEDGTTVGREGDDLRSSLNNALSEVARLKTEVAAKPKAPRESKKTKAELADANKELASAKKEIDTLNSKLSDIPNFRWVDAQDDLKLINGIGPVMEKRLNEAGITTYDQVAKADADDLYRIAEAKEWQNIDTNDWKRQARGMKSRGKVMMLEDDTIVGSEGDKLRQSLNNALSEVTRLKAEVAAKPKAPRQSPDKKLKSQLDAASAEIERLKSGAQRRGRDLLQAIDGIDDGIENRLYNNDVTTYLDLSERGGDDLREIAKVSEDVNTTLWIRQANEILAGQRRGYNRLEDISGIGEEYQSRLYDKGYYTYYDVANSSEDELRNAVYVEGETIGANYTSWIQQAYDIVGGTFLTGTRGRIGAGGWAVDHQHTNERDRLTDVDGIGPVYQRRLYAANIFTFEQLIAASNEQLDEICRVQDWQDVDLDDWKAQARLLAQAK